MLAILDSLLDYLVDEQNQVEQNIEKDDEHDEPASLNAPFHVKDPGREAVKRICRYQDHVFVDKLLPIDES